MPNRLGSRGIPDKDIIGKKYNRLTAIEHVETIVHPNRTESYWLFSCECGNFTKKWINPVRQGHTKSCGCLYKVSAQLNAKKISANNNALFWSRIVHVDTCWIWTGYKYPNGYGSVQYEGKRMLTHRLAYILTNGEISQDILVCHTCDVRACINPDHLFLGTYKDNNQDCVAKDRNSRGERHYNCKLTDEKVIEIRRRLSNGERGDFLAYEFGVAKPTISRIKKNLIWKHLSSKPTENTYEQS